MTAVPAIRETRDLRTTTSPALPKSSRPFSKAAQDPLWEQLEQFKLDQPSCGLMFSERLAKENAWSLTYTKRAVDEYKKFLFLAMRSDHIVCPSEDVDQVWHLHLTYTRSYWQQLCEQVLGKPLHHGPTQGGSEEREKYYQLYQRTQQSYRDWFGQEPPPDLWPPADQRFGEDLNCVRVNTSKHWIIPKLRWRGAAVGAGSAAVLLPIAQFFPNPLDWSGQTFLILFISLLGVAFALSLLARYLVVGSSSGQRNSDPDALGPIGAAWLQGGDQRAISCALVELAQANAIRIDGTKILPGPNADTHHSEQRVTQLILGSITKAVSGRSWRGICRDAKVGLVSLQQSLEEEGLATTFMQRTSVAAVTLASLGGVALLGGAKIWTGLHRGRPVGFLVLAELLTVVAMIVLIQKIPRMTLAGKQWLEKLRRDKADTAGKEQVLPDNREMAGYPQDSALLWSAALLGTGILAATPYAEIDSYTRSQIASAGNASSGGCGATGCGGDSGCGGGGCGGCGGCGG